MHGNFILTFFFCKYIIITNNDIIAFIFVSTNNKNPLSTFEQLQKAIDSHPIFKTEYVDPNIIKHYILIHDKRGTSDKEYYKLIHIHI